MKTVLILVGKTQNKVFKVGIDEYVSRIGHYIPFSIIIIPELKNTKSLSEEQQKQKEGELILKEIRLVFIIGGPYGFSPNIYARSNEKISLSRMTFSHQMVRLIFTEQLYRACTIIKGEPYHHE